MTIDLKRRSSDETVDIYAAGAVAMCPVCSGLIGDGYPLWGVHLHAALALHSAHKATEALRNIPAVTSTDQRFGRHLALVDREP